LEVNNMTVNERVRLVRNALNLTQKDFGNRVTLAQTYLSQIEKGSRNVTEKIFKIICHEFNVNEEWLRTGKGEMFNSYGDNILFDISKKYRLDELDEKILLTYIKLNANQRKVFKDYIKSLIDDSLTDNIPDNVLAFTRIKSEIPAVYKVDGKYKVPVIGRVSGGQPITAIENHYDTIETSIKCDLALELKGDSMEPDYPDGCILLVNRQPILETGEAGIIFILKDAVVTETTFKRFYISFPYSTFFLELGLRIKL
jgi:transcriptional regulator with XRE-family HTH domain